MTLRSQDSKSATYSCMYYAECTIELILFCVDPLQYQDLEDIAYSLYMSLSNLKSLANVTVLMQFNFFNKKIETTLITCPSLITTSI